VDTVEVQHEGAFAGAVRADQSDLLALADSDRHIVERLRPVGVSECQALDGKSLDEPHIGGVLGQGRGSHRKAATSKRMSAAPMSASDAVSTAVKARWP
jgi:hypothetical protein